jgi:CRISPR type I-E-associated protein CasB/Cse2
MASNLEERRSAIDRFVSHIHHVPDSGVVAQLRRTKFDEPAGSAFYQALAVAEVEPSAEDLPAWQAVAALVAKAQGQHQPEVPLGKALAKVDLDERRVLAFLRATGPVRFDHARAIVQVLTTKGQSFDHRELAVLLIHTEDNRGEDVRRQVARSYFRELRMKNATSA